MRLQPRLQVARGQHAVQAVAGEQQDVAAPDVVDGNLGQQIGLTPTTSVRTWRIGCFWMSSSLSGAPSSTSCRTHGRHASLLQPTVA